MCDTPETVASFATPPVDTGEALLLTIPDTPVTPASHGCPIGICEVRPDAEGPETMFTWPGCGHRLHLGCAALLVASTPRLACPSCRSPWPPGARELLSHACRQHLVAFPDPPPEVDTRTSESRSLEPPPEPTGVRPFCCPASTSPAWLTESRFGRNYLTGPCSGRLCLTVPRARAA